VAKISIVGAGPGSPEYVTPIAQKTVKTAAFVVGSERVLNLFKEDINGETLKLTAKNLNDALQKCVEYAEKGKAVALLSTGDPGFAGLLRTFRKAIKDKEIRVDVVPGISSLQVCAAKLGMSWDDVDFFSFHIRTTPAKRQKLLDTVDSGKAVMLLPNPKDFTPSEIAGFLVDRGIAADTAAFVCENLTLSNEHIEKTTLKGILGKTFASLCVMVINANRK
jgi:cobalt-precorrin-7 (C5)-methyltransferase